MHINRCYYFVKWSYYVNPHTHTHTHTHTQTHTHTHTYTYIYTYTHTHPHTHIHTLRHFDTGTMFPSVYSPVNLILQGPQAEPRDSNSGNFVCQNLHPVLRSVLYGQNSDSMDIFLSFLMLDFHVYVCVCVWERERERTDSVRVLWDSSKVCIRMPWLVWRAWRIK